MIDIEKKLATRLIENNIAGGNVVVLNQAIEYQPPAVMVQLISISGNRNEGLYQAMVYVTAITTDEYETLILAEEIVGKLDGWGDTDIEHVEFVNLIPQRSAEFAPINHSAVMTFNILYQG